MTSTKMLNEFLLKYDINGNAAIGFKDEEIYELLSSAQVDVAKEVFVKYGSIALSKLLDEAFMDVESSTECEYIVDGTYLYANDLLFILNLDINITRTFAPEILTAENVKVDIINPELIDKYKCTSFNKTVFLNPKLILGTNEVVNQNKETKLMVDAYTSIDPTTAKLHIYMVRFPNDITAVDNCELDSKWHDKVVDKAYELASMITGDRRTNIEHQINAKEL